MPDHPYCQGEEVGASELPTIMQTVTGQAAEAYLLGTIRHAVNKWVPESEKIQVRSSVRELWLCLGKLETQIMDAKHAGYNECLDDLGAPCPGQGLAPKQRTEMFLLYLAAK